LGSEVHHTVSADGLTLTLLNASDEVVLTTTISNETDQQPTYTTVLSKAFDHETALLRDPSDDTQKDTGDLYFDFDIEVEDDDGDIRDGAFKVTIVDDLAEDAPKIMELNEDGIVYDGEEATNVINTNADVTKDNTKIDGTDGSVEPTHGTARITDDGKLEYTPLNDDYSGKDTLTYVTTLDDGTQKTVTVNITVKPIADAPTIIANDISTIEDDSNTKEGTNSVDLDLTLPALSKDQTDRNSSDVSPLNGDGDYPERNGYIRISFKDNAEGTIVTKADGTELITTGTTYSEKRLKIVIVNDDGTVNEDYHYSGIDTTNTTTLTIAEYEALKIIPKEDDAQNIRVGFSVTSYELDDSGVPLDMTSDRLTFYTSDRLYVDVIAKTDPVTIDLVDTDGAGSDDVVVNSADEVSVKIDEDTAVNMKDILAEQFGDLDDSESHTYKVDGLEDGTIVTINGVSQTYSGSELTFTFPNDNYDPTFTVKAKENFSGDMSGTITLIAHDSDADSDETGIVDESDAITLNLHVKPIADDISVDDTSTSEDTGVTFLDTLALTDTDSDGSEEITEVVIKALNDGWVLRDENGDIVLTGDGSTDETISVGSGSGEVTLSDLQNYTVTPPAHSSSDDSVDISVTVKDTLAPESDTKTFDHTVDIEVTAVTDKESTDSDNADGDNDNTTNNDVQLNPDHTYEHRGLEDNWYDLYGADSGATTPFLLSASNEDDQNSGATYASEVTTVVFDNIRWLEYNSADVNNPTEHSVDEAVIKYTDTSTGTEVTATINAGVDIEIPLDSLASVELLPPPEFAGSLRVDMKVVTEDFDEDTNISAGKETSSTSELTIMYIDPQAEEALVFGIAQSVGVEDDGRNADGTVDAASAASNGMPLDVHINTADTSETFNIYFDNIPEDAAIYYDIDGDGTKELITANSDHGSVLVASASGTTDTVVSQNGDGTWKLLIEDYNSTPEMPILIPPHNSNIDFDIDVSGYAVDSVQFADGSTATDASNTSDTYPIAVKISGVADELINDELNTLSIDGVDDGYGGVTDLTNAEDTTGFQGAYAAIVEEDNGNTTVGAEINLKSVFKNGGVLNSYDDVKDNDPDQNPTETGEYGSETLTVSITGLGEGFDVDGALFLGGTGTDRVWVMKHTAINDGDVSITTEEHYSGEIDFQLKYITTEDDGDSLTTPIQDVKVLVTPKVEATILDASETTLKEDTLTQLDFKSKLVSADSDEEIVELLVLKSDVDGKTFEVYYGDSHATTLQEAAEDAGNTAVEVVTVDGKEYYNIHDANTDDIYAQHGADIGGAESGTLDDSFAFKYRVIDRADAVDADGHAVVISDLRDEPYDDATYQLGFEAVTDEFDATIKDSSADITSDTVDAIDVSEDANGIDITIKSNSTITVAVALYGADMANEVELDDSATTNGRDEDGSESISRIKIEDVPDGIGVKGGYIVSDGSIADTSNWYINIPSADVVVFDGGEKSYDVEFDVFGDDATYKAESSDVKITFFNKDGDADTTEDNVILKFTKNPAVDGGFDDSGTTTEAPMDIDSDTTGFVVDGAFTGFVEDTAQSLGGIISLNIIDGIGDTNAELNETITSQKFLLEVKDIAYGEASVSTPLGESTAGQWIKDGGSYIFRGEGDQGAIQAALDALSITPDQDYNWNTGREADPDTTLNFTANLTTYTTSGIEDFATLDYVGEVKPVTDDVTATQTIYDSNGIEIVSVNEDESATLKLDLDSVDGTYRSSVTDDSSSHTPATFYSFTYSGSFSVTLGTQVFHINFTVTVDPVADGSVDKNPDGSNPLEDVQAYGDEDTLIEITSALNESLDTLLSGGNETLTSLMLKGVPNGYLVYIGDAGSQQIALNAGEDGVDGDSNSWFIELNGSDAPKVWILPPENLGGVAPTSILLKTGVDGDIYREDGIDLQVNAIADDLAIKPSDTRGHEGDEVRLHFNMAAEDVDESEYYEVKLTGLGDGALFTVDGSLIDDADVAYDSGTDTYTITSQDVTYSTIDKMYVIQNDLAGKTIDTTVDAIEKSNANRDGASTSGSFVITIEDQVATSGDDTLLYDDSGVDGGDGTDTIVMAGDQSIEYSAIKNAEILDLKKYDRDYSLNNLTIAAVEAMTDGDNDLIIRSNAGDYIDLDSIAGTTPQAGEWVKDDDTHYHSFDDVGTTITFSDNSALIDGIIEGMYYETSSGFTGYTDADGNFDYIDGDKVTFKIGSLVIGDIDMDTIGDDKVFLQDIASVDRTDLNDEYVENLAVLLQSLDSDDGDNIVITEEMREAFSSEDFDLATIDEEALVSIIEDTGRVAVSEDDAMEHVQDMLEEYTDLEEGEFDERLDDGEDIVDGEDILDDEESLDTDDQEPLLLVDSDDEGIDMTLLYDEESDEDSSSDSDDISYANYANYTPVEQGATDDSIDEDEDEIDTIDDSSESDNSVDDTSDEDDSSDDVTTDDESSEDDSVENDTTDDTLVDAEDGSTDEDDSESTDDESDIAENSTDESESDDSQSDDSTQESDSSDDEISEESDSDSDSSDRVTLDTLELEDDSSSDSSSDELDDILPPPSSSESTDSSSSDVSSDSSSSYSSSSDSTSSSDSSYSSSSADTTSAPDPTVSVAVEEVAPVVA